MAITTYTELQDALTNYTHRAGLTARTAEFISMGEAWLNRKLRVMEMEDSVTITPSQSVSYVALPAGYMEAISFTDDLGESLVAVDAARLAMLSYGAGTSRPRYYRISSRIDFERVADAAYNYTFRFYKRLDIATDSTNSVLTNHPDIYLNASLVWAATYAKNQADVQLYTALRDEAVRQANSQANRSLKTLATEFPQPGRFDIVRGY